MHIDKFKKDDGSYEDENGLYYQDAASFIQTHVFNFCGCGMPDANLEYIRDGLAHLKTWIEPDMKYEDYKKKSIELFGNEKAEYFFYYWADKMGLTEHGGSVPGWLTQNGQQILDDLMEITKPE